MASKIFCDGCDKEIVDQMAGARANLTVRFSTAQGDTILGQFAKSQDLCKDCIESMKSLIDAKNWARHEVRKAC